LPFGASPRKIAGETPILIKAIAKKDWWSSSSSRKVSLVSVRPKVQTPVLPKKKKKREREKVEGINKMPREDMCLVAWEISESAVTRAGSCS
jgi:hypothetical protein